MRNFICLGIESSCDETATSIVKNGRKILANIVLSQVDLHKVYGGIVPEIACRAHIESILPVIDQCLRRASLPARRLGGSARQAGVQLKQLDAIAISHTPGLVGALLVGLSSAKALSFILHKPLIGINHIEAHLYAVHFDYPKILYPAIGLVASGGHTSLYLAKGPAKYQRLGGTIDDAAGEAFDKVAHILGLSYPGGPSIEKKARRGNAQSIRFPRSYLPAQHSGGSEHLYDFSFSGIKTAVLYYAKGQNASKRSPLKKNISIPDVAAGFQEAVVDTLVEKIMSAVRKKKVKSIIIGGGVTGNQRLRTKLRQRIKNSGLKLYLPRRSLCTDNAAMIAGLAYEQWKARRFDSLLLDVQPTLRVS